MTIWCWRTEQGPPWPKLKLTAEMRECKQTIAASVCQVFRIRRCLMKWRLIDRTHRAVKSWLREVRVIVSVVHLVGEQ